MNQDMLQVWQTIREEVKRQVTGRTLYRALDVLTLVTIEGDTAVLGLPHEHYQLIGHVSAPNVKKLLEQELSSAYGTPLQVLFIEGTTQQDWQLHLRKQEELKRLSEQTARKQATVERAYTTWDTLYEQVGRKFAETPARSLALNRARYMAQAIEMVREALTRLPLETEHDERQLNRVIERIASNAEVPPTMVAWLVLNPISAEEK